MKPVFPLRSGYNDDQIYAKVDDMTYYPVNNILAASLPNTNSTTSTTRDGGGGGVGNHNSATLAASSAHHHLQSKTLNFQQPAGSGNSLAAAMNPKASDFQAFGTVHRSQKIYL